MDAYKDKDGSVPPIDIVDGYARFEFIDGSLSLVINLIKYEESR